MLWEGKHVLPHRYVLFYPLPQSAKPHMLRQIRTDGWKTAVFIFIPLLTAVTEMGV